MFCVTTRTAGNSRARAARASCPALGVFRVKLMGKCLRKNSLYHRRGSRRNTERLPWAAAVMHQTESLPPRNVGMPVIVVVGGVGGYCVVFVVVVVVRGRKEGKGHPGEFYIQTLLYQRSCGDEGDELCAGGGGGFFC